MVFAGHQLRGQLCTERSGLEVRQHAHTIEMSMRLDSLLASLKHLPDYGPPSVYLPLFREICSYKCTMEYEGKQLLAMLFELAERQWETGEYLEPSVRADLDKLLPTIWDPEEMDSTEMTVTVVLCLALQDTWIYMQERMNTISNPKVVTELSDAFEQYGRGTLDPWHDY